MSKENILSDNNIIIRYIYSTMFLNLMIDYYESWIYSIYISSAFEILMNERINYFLTEH